MIFACKDTSFPPTPPNISASFFIFILLHHKSPCNRTGSFYIFHRVGILYFVIVITPAERAGTESTTSLPSVLGVAFCKATAFLFSMLLATVSEPGA